MGQKRMTKKVDKLESKAEELRAKAAELSEKASDRVSDIGKDDSSGGGKKGLLALVVAAVAGLGVFLKKKREQELDEALWEEPRAL